MVCSGAHREGAACLRWVDLRDAAPRELVLPGRMHGMVQDPSAPQRVLVFARRPGWWLAALDLCQGALASRGDVAPGRHLQGHGVLGADGSMLYTTENAFASGEGRVGVRDACTLRQLGEFPSAGIGPHDICRLAGEDVLVVANGGIRTHPSRPRQKLDLEHMAPNLSYLDCSDGRLIEQHALRDAKASIRHLAVTSRNEVIAVQQYEGPYSQPAPLVAMHRRGEALRVAAAPSAVLRRMNRYTASVAVDASGHTALVTSPRGHLVTLWDVVRASFIASLDLERPSGAAWVQALDAFAVSGAGGALSLVGTRGALLVHLGADRGWHPDDRWDDHLGSIA